jgi:hypothetical protein
MGKGKAAAHFDDATLEVYKECFREVSTVVVSLSNCLLSKIYIIIQQAFNEMTRWNPPQQTDGH